MKKTHLRVFISLQQGTEGGNICPFPHDLLEIHILLITRWMFYRFVKPLEKINSLLLGDELINGG